MKLWIMICMMFLFSALVTGCGKPESKFIGNWIGKTGTFEFLNDKTGVINPPAGVDLPRNVRFKWSLQGSDTVRIDVGPPVGKTFFGKMLTSDNLIIEDDKFVKQK